MNQKQVPPQAPRTWQGGHGCAGRGTTGVPPSASESSAGEVVALGLNRSFFQNSIQNIPKVAGERIELNFDQNFDQNKVVQKEM